MTVKDMLINFQSLLELTWKDFEESEKPGSDIMLKMLNLAYDRYIKEKYLSGVTMTDTILLLQKNPGDLYKMIKRASGLTIDSVEDAPNRSLITLPDDYLYYIRSDSKLTRIDILATTNTWTPNREGTYEEVRKITTSPQNAEVIIKEPVVLFEQNSKLLIYTDSYTTLLDIELTYLREPKELVIDSTASPSTMTEECELAEHTHTEIVRLAVEMFIAEYKFRLAIKESEKPAQ